MDEHGRWLPKSRKVYDLDEKGERIRIPSGNWKSHKESTVDWNEQSKAEVWRHGWEVTTNRFLERNGRSERVDLRSFERQGLDLAPTIHLGPAVTQMEKRGVQTELGNYNREIRRMNQILLSVRKTITAQKSRMDRLVEERYREESRELTLPELLTEYLDERKAERSDWSSYAQTKGSAKDLKRVSEAVVYLQTHEINTLSELEQHVAEKEAALSKIRNTVRGKEKRIRDIDALLKAPKTIKQYEPLQKEKTGIILKKWREDYYRQHKDALDAYYRAQRLIRKYYPDGKVPTPTLLKERNKLKEELEWLQPKVNELSEELENLSVVRICLAPPKEKAAPTQEVETHPAPEPRKAITPQQEKASAIGRLHKAQQIVDENDRRKQADRKKSYSIEH